MAIKWRRKNSALTESEAIAYGNKPPARGVVDGARMVWRLPNCARRRRKTSNFDRPGGDYTSAPVPSGDPEDCALLCERDRRCRPGAFNYPTDAIAAQCAGSRAACGRCRTIAASPASAVPAVVEPRNGAVETSIDRPGGDYKSFEIKSGEGDEPCKAACHRRQQMPRLDLCAGRLCRPRSALLPEKRNQAAAAARPDSCRAWCANSSSPRP